MPAEDWEVKIQFTADHSDVKNKMQEMKDLGANFGATIRRSFADAIFSGRKLSDVFRNLALNLSELVLDHALKPVLDGGFSNIFENLTKTVLTQPRNVTPFANGGVLGSPIAFPLGNGQAGLAGEAGPEAILPLARGSDGRLGVKAEGGGAITINFNVTTPDAESFRRSESQVAAMLNRAVSRGQRNL